MIRAQSFVNVAACRAPKWLQDCMLSVGLRWHTIEQVQWPGVKMSDEYIDIRL